MEGDHTAKGLKGKLATKPDIVLGLFVNRYAFGRAYERDHLHF
jgi:hypothetical protein